ncbi:cell surface protein [Agrilactobacillus composti DSM 18527 = JCM 14202]|uniref:Cell surface protein n=2 Tax=Agrilactobacillus TaxID=2767875 RepID=A0A0R1XY45_9LACO|nr:DUF916 and DUF3324 domain-containing protein [Agrilactobacillus composti]KRM34938.1 cell surface protein [Agrilactobacillus composti DSM 18527 = JCM 14202]
MKIKTYFYAVIVALAGFLGLAAPQAVQAAGTPTGAQFYIAPAYPDNQTDKSLGYFDLKVAPGQTGKLGVVVQNTSKTDSRTIQVTPIAATTNNAGQINYTPSKKKADKSAQYRLNQLFSKPVAIHLEPEESKTVSFEYIIPKDGFKGQILGSIYAFDQTSQAKSKTQFGLSNEFAMALGVSLNQNPDEKLIPDLKLNKVAPDAVNRIPYIIANVANVAPTMFRGMTVNADVTRQGNAKRVYHKTINDGSMAPNSNFDLQIPTGKNAIEPGKYHLKLVIHAVDKTWTFNRNFTVTDTQNKAINKKVGTKKTNNWTLWIIVIVILLLVINGILLAYYLRRRKQQSKHAKGHARRRH